MAYTSREEIIWRPLTLYQPTCEFGILLSREFTSEMLKLRIGTEGQERLNELAVEFVFGWYKCSQPTPYYFREDTALINQFNLNLGKGEWLALDGCFGKNPLEVHKGLIKYESHNLESITDAYALMALVDFWV